MNKLALTLAISTSLVAFSSAFADETRPLADLTVKDGWKPEQWNKAEGRVGVRPDFPDAVTDVPADKKQSLGVKISWPGGEDFRFFNINPVNPSDPIPFKAKSVSVWLTGTGTDHTFQLNFEDADGKGQKMSPGGGSMNFEGWKQLKGAIPATWPQPLTFKSITFHNYSDKKAADMTTYIADLQITVDPSQKVGGGPGEVRALTDLNLPGEWKASQYNKATGTVSIVDDFPADLKTDAGSPRKSLQGDIKFAGFGDGFQFYSLQPSTSTPIPFKLLQMKLWMKGPNAPELIEFHFKDADGTDQKVTPSPGNLKFDGWRQVTARIPAGWAQPLSFSSVTFHNYGITDPAEFKVAMTRLEAVIDPAQPVGGATAAKKTNDNW